MQRIPPSGGAPAYKLTLPHGIVTQQLAHFIDTTFELAASEESCKCWQGRIGARRNKERSEFVLQGWKLFAEAHGILAGDQVSFHVLGRHRLVVKKIQAETDNTAFPSARIPEELQLSPNEAAAKIRKSSDCSSPSRQSALVSLKLNASPVAGMDILTPGSISRDSTLHALPKSQSSSPPRKRDLLPRSRSMARDVESYMANMQVDGLSTHGLVVNERAPYDEAPQEVPRSCGSVTARAVASQNSIPPAASQPDPGLPGIFDGLEDLLDPGLRLHNRQGLDLGRHSFSLNSMHRPRPPPLSELQAYGARDESPNELGGMMRKICEQLDVSSRAALTATMKIERNVKTLSNTRHQHEMEEIQTRMFTHLSTLKESLWQILVIANETYSPLSTSSTTAGFDAWH